MKVLTLIEPWASLIKEKVKYVETRSFKTNYRGTLYIHTSQKKINQKDERMQQLLSLLKDTNFCYGSIIAKCRLVDCICMDEAYIEKMKREHVIEYMCGEYSKGRYAWILEEIEPLESPIPAKGHLNIWNYIEGEK